MNEHRKMENTQHSAPLLQQAIQAIVAGIEDLTSTVRAIISDEQFQEMLQGVAAWVEGMTFWEWVEKTCADSGYLPNRIVPFREFYLEHKDDYDLFSARVSEYYQYNEEDILEDIESNLKTLAIDMDRKATFQEAIKAHRHGLFRLTTRALIPDIERVILEDWMGRNRGDVEQLTKQKICDAVNKKHLEDFALDNIYDLRLFGGIVDVLYENGSKLGDFQGDIFPNRPAALHGWLSYSTRKNSLNIIIIADYVFRLTPLFKENRS